MWNMTINWNESESETIPSLQIIFKHFSIRKSLKKKFGKSSRISRSNQKIFSRICHSTHRYQKSHLLHFFHFSTAIEFSPANRHRHCICKRRGPWSYDWNNASTFKLFEIEGFRRSHIWRRCERQSRKTRIFDRRIVERSGCWGSWCNRLNDNWVKYDSSRGIVTWQHRFTFAAFATQLPAPTRVAQLPLPAFSESFSAVRVHRSVAALLPSHQKLLRFPPESTRFHPLLHQLVSEYIRSDCTWHLADERLPQVEISDKCGKQRKLWHLRECEHKRNVKQVEACQ